MTLRQWPCILVVMALGLAACRGETQILHESDEIIIPISLEPNAVGSKDISYAKVANWVEPVELNKIDPTKRDLDVLLSNKQERISKGLTETYQAAAMRVNTSRGLAGAGQIGAQWDPHTQILTIHNVLIQRDGESIDALKEGPQFTILRREKNLEQAWIDGINTASLQLQDLRVGDIIFFDYSIVSRDIVWPHATGGIYTLFESDSNVENDIRVIWPDNLTPSIKTPDWLDVTPVSVMKGYSEINFNAADIPETKFESRAPARFVLKNTVEISSNSNWRDFSKRYSQYFDLASQVPNGSEIEKEIDKIKSNYKDPVARVEAALKFTQENIRYLFVGLNSGGYVPVSAAETTRLKYGDCKAKTALLFAFLKAFEIPAEPVLVHSQIGDAIPERLPSMAVFDHVILRAEIDGKTYWLDGTRSGEVDLDRMQVGAFFWGLPITSEGSDLVEIKTDFPDYITSEISAVIDAKLGTSRSVDIDATRTYRGVSAAYQSSILKSSNEEQLERRIKSAFYGLGSLKEGETSFNEDEETGDITVKFVGEMKLKNTQNDLKRSVKIPGFSFRSDFPLAYGSHKKRSDDRETPFSTTAPINSSVKVVIKLPDNFSEVYSYEGLNFGYETDGVELVRTVSIEDNTLKFERVARVEATELPAKDVFDLRFKLKDFSDNRSQNIVTYALDKSLNKKPVKSKGNRDNPKSKKQKAIMLVESGNDYLNSGDLDLAKSDFDMALNLDASNSYAWANRGIVSIWQNEYSEGHSYLDKALELDSDNYVALQGYGFYYEKKGDCVAALRYFKQVIRLKPSASFSRFREVTCLAQLDRFEEARSKLDAFRVDFADDSHAESLGNFIDAREKWVEDNKNKISSNAESGLEIAMPKIEINIEK